MTRGTHSQVAARASMSRGQQPELLLILGCFLLCCPLNYTHSTPIQIQHGRGGGGDHEPCAHASIAELIRTSPVILKALGARIFTDDDLSALQIDSSGQLRWLKSASTTTTSTTTARPSVAHSRWQPGSGKMAPSVPSAAKVASILITLTPETIYKGASLLKLTPGAERAAAGSASEFGQLFESQLNATLQPAGCFDNNVLKVLPSELIIFGKLVTAQQQQQRLQQQQQRLQLERHELPLPLLTQQQLHPAALTDILEISINGFHRWSSQFENHIWKHLGWDNWSDFTVCSVTCGKGVQQRFRRCLLDNPMVNLNMNINMQLNMVDIDGDEGDEANDNDVDGVESDDDAVSDGTGYGEGDGDGEGDGKGEGENIGYGVDILIDEDVAADDELLNNTPATTVTSGWTPAAALGQAHKSLLINRLTTGAAAAAAAAAADDDAEAAVAVTDADVLGPHGQSSLTSDNDNERKNNDAVSTTTTATSGSDGNSTDSGSKAAANGANESEPARRPHPHRKRRKPAKGFSTMFCEGYNIEQRNCNTFECSDDISDLLKFYKKFNVYEDVNTAAQSPAASPAMDFDTATTTTTPSTTTASASTSTTTAGASVLGAEEASSGNAAQLALPSSTPANMGYIRSWRNALNFTLMLTLRAKSGDSKSSETIFSIRNATHNLYLEPCKDGLRLYLERDKTTEMLPVKFNLFDYRWHQVAISIQNGDFISIYVDCSWTNSFVVSKRLFSLPLDADVEIGRGFNGELQQLLVLPDNQERLQCSHRRTSINEVKRYIIDTFIDDYVN